MMSQIGELSKENNKLKIEVSSKLSSRSNFIQQEEYERYNLKVRENNIMHINSRNLSQSEKMSQYGEE